MLDLGLPPSLKATVVELYRQPLADTGELRQELDAYLERAGLVFPPGSHRRYLAEQIATRALSMLDSLGPEGPEDQRRAVQAAARYLMMTDDAYSDFESEQGLEDDAQVFNAVCTCLGREDLILEEEQQWKPL